MGDARSTSLFELNLTLTGDNGIISLSMAYNQLHYSCRSGPQDRVHPDRFTYIEGQGWFIYLRGDQEHCNNISVSSGIVGPFDTRFQARVYLTKFIRKQLEAY